MKLFYILSFFFCISLITIRELKSQPRQVISASGGGEVIGDFDLVWTLGQIEVQTYENGDFMLTQGFQQPFANPLEIDTSGQGSIFGILVSPNPCSEYFKITFTKPDGGDYDINLFNTSGQVIFNESVRLNDAQGNNNEPQQFNFKINHLAKGIYLLVINDRIKGKFNSQKVIIE